MSVPTGLGGQDDKDCIFLSDCTNARFGWLYCCCTNIFILYYLIWHWLQHVQKLRGTIMHSQISINVTDSLLPQVTDFKMDAPTKWGIAPPPSDAGCISRLLFFCAASADVMSMSSKFVFYDCGHDSCKVDMI